MASDLHLHGVWVPLITPFDESGAVDVDAIERLCGEYLADGVAGIVALGTTGESPALDADEKRAVVEACSRVCAPRGAPLIVGTGTNNTRSTIAETRRARRCSRRGRRARRRAVLQAARRRPRSSSTTASSPKRARCRSSRTTFPSRTGRGLGAASLLELAAMPNVAGVKQAVAALDARHARGARQRARRLQRAERRRLPRVPDGVHGRRGRDHGVGALVHRPLRRDGRVRPRGQARRRPASRRGAAPVSWTRPSPSRTPRCSRACCTRRAGSRLPTCACRWRTRRAAAIDRCLAAVEHASR